MTATCLAESTGVLLQSFRLLDGMGREVQSDFLKRKFGEVAAVQTHNRKSLRQVEGFIVASGLEFHGILSRMLFRHLETGESGPAEVGKGDADAIRRAARGDSRAMRAWGEIRCGLGALMGGGFWNPGGLSKNGGSRMGEPPWIGTSSV